MLNVTLNVWFNSKVYTFVALAITVSLYALILISQDF